MGSDTPEKRKFEFKDKEPSEETCISWNSNRTTNSPSAVGAFCSWVTKWVGRWSVAALLECDGASK